MNPAEYALIVNDIIYHLRQVAERDPQLTILDTKARRAILTKMHDDTGKWAAEVQRRSGPGSAPGLRAETKGQEE